MDTKKLSKVTMLLTTFLLAIPFAPTVFAPAPPNVSVAFDNAAVLPGASIMATASLSPVSMLDAYDLELQWNPDVLTATSATFTGTLLDGFPGFHAISLFPAAGFVHAFTVRTDGGSVSPATTSPMLFMNFMVNVPPAKSLSELPTTVHVFSAQLDLGGVLVIPTTSTTATYTLPLSYFTALANNINVRTFFCKSSPTTLNTNSNHGSTIDLQCSIINDSTSDTIPAGAIFSWTSLLGFTGSSGAPAALLAPGQNAVVSAPISVKPSLDIYTITAVVGYGFPDGGVVPGASPVTFTFQLQVNVPPK